jgi:Uma2 family endonuclease
MTGMITDCTCGFEADGFTSLDDHFSEVFTPADDTDATGQVHLEVAGLRCSCGLEFTRAGDLDGHFRTVFPPPADRTGPDGKQHSPAPGRITASGGGQLAAQHMVLPVPPHGGFTTADLPALDDAIDHWRYELLDGHVLLTGPEIIWHDEAVGFLVRALRQATPPHLAVTRSTGIDLGATMPIADILLVPRHALTAQTVMVAPADVVLAVEVASPRTAYRDGVLRPAIYARAGIPFLWIAHRDDDDAIVIRAFRLPPGGGYAPDGAFHDRVTLDRPFPLDIAIPRVTL